MSTVASAASSRPRPTSRDPEGREKANTWKESEKACARDRPHTPVGVLHEE